MRIFEFLLLIYPRRFRERVGAELIQTLRDSHRHAVARHGRLRAWARAAFHAVDLVVGGLMERLRGLRRRSHNSYRSYRPHTLPRRPKESPMSSILNDLRYALRWLRKHPGFTIAVVFTVALGVGANTAMFSVVHGVLLRQLPYEEPDELAFIFQTDRVNDTRREGVSGPDYFDYLEQQTAFESLAAYTGAPNPTLTPESADPRRLNAIQVTHTFFPTLGWSAAVGRTFLPSEDRPDGPAVVVLSHGLWVSGYGAEPDIVGSTIRLDGNPYTVVGVMPADFRFAGDIDIWMPLQYGPTTRARGVHNLLVVGRLRDGVSLTAAQDEMSRIMAALEEQYPADNVGRGANVEAMAAVFTGHVRPTLLLLMGAVVLVLLISCVNVANLLFTRSTARRREVAVRAAMGAGRWRLVGQFLAESLVLATGGGVLGIALAFTGLKLLHALGPAALPRLNSITLSTPVLLFALAVSIATGALFGILPALRVSRAQMTEDLKEGGRSSTGLGTNRMRASLAVSQVALAFMLTVGAGLLVRSMWNLSRVDPGFRPENLVRLSLNLPAARYPNSFRDWPNVPEVLGFHTEVLQRARRLPSVRSAALAVNPPTAAGFTTRVQIEGGPETVEEGIEEERLRPVSEGYFATAGIPLLKGRDFNRFDDSNAALVAVVNQSFVNKYFPADDPIGKRFQFWGNWREIVGVVGDVKFMGIDQAARPAFYAPLSQVPFSGFDIILRTDVPPERVVQAMHAEIREMDSQLAVFNTASVEGLVAATLAPQRFNVVMFGLFAALALSLAVIGIYGVIAYNVGRRLHEFGVRMSLGADTRRIIQLVLSQGGQLVASGILIGLVGALLASRLVAGLLFDVEPVDPVTLVAVALILALVALTATLVPALRAGRVNPVVALREE